MPDPALDPIDVGQRIVSDIDIPLLAEAMGERGYALVLSEITASDDPDIAAILRRWTPGVPIGRSRIPQIAVAVCHASVAAALDAGAADAVAQPVDAHELAARLDARIRSHLPPPIEVGELRIDPARRIVWRAGHRIDLLPREFALLLHLAERPGEFVTRAALLKAVWRLRIDPGTNVVAVHVSKLRARLDRHFPASAIESAKGLGYRIAGR